MNQIAIYKHPVRPDGPGCLSNPEMALLGGQAPVLNQTRVMVANHQSRFVRPADLDAALQGLFAL
ncbi:MAG: hypothetical protein KKB20_28220 [Proteobacteria bacterium]|nr:hypothetical protein [Pseudomonadota bacterium]